MYKYVKGPMKLFLMLIISAGFILADGTNPSTPDPKDVQISAQTAMIKWQEEEIAILQAKLKNLNENMGSLDTYWRLKEQGLQHQAQKPTLPQPVPVTPPAAQ